MTSAWRTRRATTSVAFAVVLALFAFAPKSHTTVAGCPAGFRPAGAEEATIFHADGDKPDADKPDADKADANPALAGTVCLNDLHPESLEDLEAMAAQRGAIRTAPDGFVPAGAFLSAIAQ